jgi:hypothetical protein
VSYIEITSTDVEVVRTAAMMLAGFSRTDPPDLVRQLSDLANRLEQLGTDAIDEQLGPR